MKFNTSSKSAPLSTLDIHPGLASGTCFGFIDSWFPPVTAFRTCLMSHMFPTVILVLITF